MIRLNQTLLRNFALGISTAALLSSCGGLAVNEILFPHNVARQAAFNEAEFSRSRGSGSGVVRGQAFLFNMDDSKLCVPNNKVELFPVTAHTNKPETISRKYANGVYLAAPDPRLAKYVRSTTSDGNGNFQFSGIPAGQ